MQFVAVENFDQWRDAARGLLQQNVLPADVHFDFGEQESQTASLFDSILPSATAKPASNSFRVPKELITLFQKVSHHRDPNRWQRMYRTLYRMANGEPHLLQIDSDEDVLTLRRMESSVRRDAHKMTAFVRFRKTVVDSEEHYIAWHRPDHFVVPLTASFFAARFKSMNWTILTPDASVSWDQQRLMFGPGVASSSAPKDDVVEAVWLTYYRSIFNPARIKWRAMVKELPVRHWPTLPETAIIDDILAEAPKRVEQMIKNTEGFTQSAADYIPANYKTLEELATAAADCKGCPLCEPATQTVFGVGKSTAKIVMVGEQPGDKEDLAGLPFVGPAGKILDDALAQAGIDRETVYITNAVKHFKFQQRGKLRLHAKPGSREITACKPWLMAELKLVQPQRLVCLGATAATAIIGRGFSITRQRGQFMDTEYCPQTIATYHPSAILRVPDKEASARMFEDLVSDLKQADVGMVDK